MGYPSPQIQISNLIIDTLLWVRGALFHLGNCGRGRSLEIFLEKYIKDGKVLAQLGFRLKVLPGSLTDLSVSVG
jgi:hypothetical protein